MRRELTWVVQSLDNSFGITVTVDEFPIFVTSKICSFQNGQSFGCFREIFHGTFINLNFKHITTMVSSDNTQISNPISN